jgi:putative serine protease PepD
MLSSAPHRRRRRRFGPWVALIVVIVLAGAAGAVIAGAFDSDSTDSLGSGSSGCDVTAVAQHVLPTVVTIKAVSDSGSGVGSGEVIKSGGYILTNNHVIAPAAGGGSLEVLFENGNSASGQLVGRDPATDLAVVRVSGQSDLPTISVGDSSKLLVGQPVVALGSPLGLPGSVTAGIVSALGRAVHVPGAGSQAVLLTDAVQTDAAINPGNSGGALVDCAGKLVGIPSAGASTGQSSGNIGLGFAIPVNAAVRIADELISTGHATHAYIGLEVQPLAASAEGESGQPGGLSVTAVAAGSPAGAAGLRTGDIIRSIAGTPATSPDQLLELTLRKRPGDRVELSYERARSTSTATITLAPEP